MSYSTEKVLRRARREESGLSMVEMMIALLVLGVVLSALASVLITSIRAIVTAEREVQATALAQQEIETLQTIDWDQVGLYADEIPASDSVWDDVLQESPELVAAERALIPAPGAVEDRAPQVQPPMSTEDRQGVTYTILRYVTWVDRAELSLTDPIADTKRFHVVVQWPTLTGQRQIVATGERSPTQGESPASEEGVRVLSFTRSPDPVFVDPAGLLASTVTVEVRFNRGVTQGSLRYFVPTDVTDHDGSAGSYVIREAVTSVGTRPDVSNGFPTIWTFTITPGSNAFVPGTLPLQFRGRLPSLEWFETEASLQIRPLVVPDPDDVTSEPVPVYTYPAPPPGGGTIPVWETPPPTDAPFEPVDPTPVVITGTTAIPTQMCINGNSGSLKNPLTVDVFTTGLSSVDLVKVSYEYLSGNGNNATRQIADVDVGFLSGVTSAATWKGTIASSNQQIFEANETVVFTIEARRAADDQNTSTTISKVVAKC